MKKIFLLVACSYLTPAVAQEIPTLYTVGVFGGVAYNMMDFKSYNNFRESYNSTFRGSLSEELGTLAPTISYAVGVQGSIAFANMQFVRHFGTYKTLARFKNGDTRELELDFPAIDFNMDLMLVPEPVHFNFGMAMGLMQQKSTLKFGYRYANNDFLSYTSSADVPISGIFRMKNAMTMNFGARIDYFPIAENQHFQITVRGEYVGAFQNFVTSKPELTPHRDEMMGNSASPVNTNGSLRYYQPEDLKNANNDYVYFVGLPTAFNSVYQGWRIMLTVHYNFITGEIDE